MFGIRHGRTAPFHDHRAPGKSREIDTLNGSGIGGLGREEKAD